MAVSGWKCPAAVNIAGEHYGCAETNPHGHSSVHGNTDGSVIWSCGEAWTHGGKQ